MLRILSSASAVASGTKELEMRIFRLRSIILRSDDTGSYGMMIKKVLPGPVHMLSSGQTAPGQDTMDAVMFAPGPVVTRIEPELNISEAAYELGMINADIIIDSDTFPFTTSGALIRGQGGLLSTFNFREIETGLIASSSIIFTNIFNSSIPT